jgi:hypothetical protein
MRKDRYSDPTGAIRLWIALLLAVFRHPDRAWIFMRRRLDPGRLGSSCLIPQKSGPASWRSTESWAKRRCVGEDDVRGNDIRHRSARRADCGAFELP